MTALISIQLCLHWRPARVPDRTVLIDIELTSTHINRYVVVTVTSDSSKTSVFVEGISSGSVGNQGEEPLCA